MPKTSHAFLVADDDPLMISTLEQLLKRQGHDVDTATDGRTALEKARNKSYDFVICDVKMAGMDGVATIKSIKSIQPDVRSVIITGFASEKAPVDAIKIGVDDYIYKPFELDEFLHIISRNLEDLELRRENERMHKETLSVNEELRKRVKDLQAAAGVQQLLIPKTIPLFPGVRFGARYEPSHDGVGGDYYDFIELGDDRLGVVIADVSGHDLAAALVMTMGRTLFRTHARNIEDPKLVLELTSQSLLEDTASNIYITLFYAVFDFKARMITHANAGHNLPFFISPHKRPLQFGRPGYPLGIIPDSRYVIGRFPMTDKSKILFYTDGVIEAMNPDRKEFGEGRLRRFLAEHRDAAPVDMVNMLYDEVRRFADGQAFEDDITLVAIDWDGG